MEDLYRFRVSPAEIPVFGMPHRQKIMASGMGFEPMWAKPNSLAGCRPTRLGDPDVHLADINELNKALMTFLYLGGSLLFKLIAQKSCNSAKCKQFLACLVG